MGFEKGVGVGMRGGRRLGAGGGVGRWINVTQRHEPIVARPPLLHPPHHSIAITYIPKVGVDMTMCFGAVSRMIMSRISSDPAPATTFSSFTPCSLWKSASAVPGFVRYHSVGNGGWEEGREIRREKK
jgi:hypothetical protein